MAAGDGRVHRGTTRVGLNATALFEGGSGVQTYVRELLRALGDVDSAAVEGFAVTAIVDRAIAGSVSPPLAARAVRADTGVLRKIQSALPTSGFDVMHGLDVDIPLVARGARRIATIHDLAQLDTPWAFGRSGIVKRRLIEFACRRADTLIAVSDFTAERIRTRFGRDSVVVHEAARPFLGVPAADDVARIRRRMGLPGHFVLHVGNLEPRKDVATLAAACREAGVPLVLAGGAVHTVEVPTGAHALGYVDDTDLAALFAAATVVAYVSRYEGFGLPPIEALACGATVMATRVGALADVAPTGIAFVPIGDVEAQAVRLRELFADGDQRRELAAAGLAESSRLSWASTATKTAAVWRA
jgi:glycosyltransferase involved in cell wall biosynthesis